MSGERVEETIIRACEMNACWSGDQVRGCCRFEGVNVFTIIANIIIVISNEGEWVGNGLCVDGAERVVGFGARQL